MTEQFQIYDGFYGLGTVRELAEDDAQLALERVEEAQHNLAGGLEAIGQLMYSAASNPHIGLSDNTTIGVAGLIEELALVLRSHCEAQSNLAFHLRTLAEKKQQGGWL